MNQKELTKIFMIISNWKKLFGLNGLYKNMSALLGLTGIYGLLFEVVPSK